MAVVLENPTNVTGAPKFPHALRQTLHSGQCFERLLTIRKVLFSPEPLTPQAQLL